MNSINKKQMIAEVARESGINQQNTKTVWDSFVKVLTRHLIAGDRVSVDGFGTFSITDSAERQARNPQTGEAIAVAVHKNPHLKFGKNIKDYVNGREKFEG